MADPTLPSQGSADVFAESPPTLTSGGVSPQTVDSNWYYLRISYRDKTGAMQTGYPYESTDTYWANYMIIRPGGPSPDSLRFRKAKAIVNPDGREWDLW